MFLALSWWSETLAFGAGTRRALIRIRSGRGNTEMNDTGTHATTRLPVAAPAGDHSTLFPMRLRPGFEVRPDR